MKKNDKRRKSKKPHHENPLADEITPGQRKQNTNALEEEDKDMENDAEFTAHSKNDDLDEGETARLGDENNDLV